MSLELRDFWSWRGRVGRSKFAGLGLILFAIKHNLDRLVAHYFGYDWTILDYWIFDEARVLALSQRRAGFYAALVLLALPFIWVGVVLTIRRLRDAGLPLWLVMLFFAPFVNLIFFLILSAFPSASPEDANRSVGLKFQSALSAIIPRGEFGSALMGILITVLLSDLFAILAVYGMGQYGWGLFLGIPFFLGLNSVLIYGVHQPRSFWKCLLVSLLSVFLAGAILFAIAFEGAICLVMAAPLAIILALIGGIVGYFIQRRESSPPVHVFSSALILLLPSFIVLEPLVAHTPPQYQVQTSVIINANRAEVWKHVVSFSPLPPPSERLFQTGIAYPIRAEIEGRGVGAVRHCVFSTGAFVEPITIWDEPRLLRFDVRAQPRVMDEWSPYNLRPPHLENYLVSREGQFLLMELPDGRTLLQGTTVYQNRFWPGPYWRIWSDYIIHRIHSRVLEHIKNLAEEKREPQP